jgi:drug/metabolite transporter (DMT)-like permease
MAPFTDSASLYAAPLAVAALHDGFAAAYVNLFNLLRRRLPLLLATLRTRAGLVVCAAALLGGPFAMSGYVLGISFAGAAYAMAITTTFPAVGALLAALFLHERVSRRGAIGIAVSIAGAIVVGYTPPADTPPHFYLGLALSALATVGWGAEIVLVAASMRSAPSVDPAIANGIRQLASVTVYAVVVLPIVGGWVIVGEVAGAPSMAVIAAAALAGTLSYLAYYTATRRIGVSRATPLNVTYALWGVVLGVAFFGLETTPGLVVGVVLAVAGAILVVSAPRAVAGPP